MKKRVLKEGNTAKLKKLWELRGLEKQQFSTLDGVQTTELQLISLFNQSEQICWPKCACVCDGEKQIATLSGGCALKASTLPHMTLLIFS